MSTVDHWTSIMAGGRAASASSSRRQALKEQALSFLIGSRWVIGEAAAQGLTMSDQEIARQVAQKESASFPGGKAELREYLHATGQRVADIVFEAKVELGSAKIRQLLTKNEPDITFAEVARYYTRNRQRFAIPRRREIEITNRKGAAEAAAIRSEVASGRSFARVSRREWVEWASEPRSGATRGTRKQGALEKAIFSARPDVLTGPVKQGVDYFLFEVKQITGGSYEPLSQVRSAIFTRLTTERQRRAIARFIRAWRRTWIAETDCRAGYVVQKCRQYKGSKATLPEDPYTLT
jgi:hypothetical protein